MKHLDLPFALQQRRQFGFFDDFVSYVNGDLWTRLISDVSGGASVATTNPDAAGGVLKLNTGDSTDNDEVYVWSLAELFLFADDKPGMFEARVKFTEANTDDANILVGLMDAVAANALLDDGGGPAASYSGAVFHKVDGGTKWLVETSIGSSQTTSTTDVTAGGGVYMTLRCEWRTVQNSVAEVVFSIDDGAGSGMRQCRDSSNRPIKHTLTHTSATEMALVLGVKNGGANPEALFVDYAGAWQLR